MRLAISSLLLFALLASGCAAVLLGGAAAGGTYVYVSGKLTRTYKAPLSKTYAACQAALKDLQLPLETQEKTLGSASLRAHDGENTVYIDLTSVDRDQTEVSVRVGVSGDEQASKRIHEAIQRRL